MIKPHQPYNAQNAVLLYFFLGAVILVEEINLVVNCVIVYKTTHSCEDSTNYVDHSPTSSCYMTVN